MLSSQFSRVRKPGMLLGGDGGRLMRVQNDKDGNDSDDESIDDDESSNDDEDDADERAGETSASTENSAPPDLSAKGSADCGNCPPPVHVIPSPPLPFSFNFSLAEDGKGTEKHVPLPAT
mmetsp:Transcript_6686/g.10128  ORF Transcript_6686/g.10128 Transcript_6686/m.10128 type:complete len:120 (-) Transcript_6686:241-600(-)